MNLCVIFMFIYFFLLEFIASDEPQKIHLTVYYESKCPDSKAFITNQLIPAMKILDKYVLLKMVPFGKACSINQGLGGFECQHGETECLGNLVQDCALSYMSDRSIIDKVGYVECEMQTLAASQGDLMCVHNANVPEEQIRQCVGSDEGVMLQLESESLTKQIKPSFIPTVTIDDTFNQDIQDSSLIDLVGVLCSVLKEAAPCVERYNNQALKYVLL